MPPELLKPLSGKNFPKSSAMDGIASSVLSRPRYRPEYTPGEPITLTFYGEPPAHKNEKMPSRRRRKSDGQLVPSIRTKPEVKAAMDRLAVQVPGWARDLNLEHPAVEVQFYVVRDTFDRSNGWCCIEDILWQYGVLVDDNVRHFNGKLTVHPAIMSDEWRTEVTLVPMAAEAKESPRYVDPRPSRHEQPRLGLCPACGSDRPDACRLLGHIYPVQYNPVPAAGEHEDMEDFVPEDSQ